MPGRYRLEPHPSGPRQGRLAPSHHYALASHIWFVRSVEPRLLEPRLQMPGRVCHLDGSVYVQSYPHASDLAGSGCCYVYSAAAMIPNYSWMVGRDSSFILSMEEGDLAPWHSLHRQQWGPNNVVQDGICANPDLTDVPSGQIRETGVRISSSALKSVALMKDVEGDVF